MKRSLLIFIFGLFIGIVVAAGLSIYFHRASTEKKGQAPRLAGQAVPSQFFRIDFSRRYDLICSSFSGDQLVYRNCKVLGFTGGGQETTGPSGSLSKYEFFDKWLVLELPDKRLVFLPPSEIRALEQSSVIKE